jgi:glutaredoxin-like protein
VKARKPQSVSIITKPGCPFCAKAKEMLAERDMDYEEIVLGRDATFRSVRAITGKETAPQVFIDGHYIGDSEDLKRRLRGDLQEAR